METKRVEPSMPVSEIRFHFETAVISTPLLKSHMPMDMVSDGEGGLAYKNDDTQKLWEGWFLGMRCADRIARCRGLPGLSQVNAAPA